jgi:hypothetical protein
MMKRLAQLAAGGEADGQSDTRSAYYFLGPQLLASAPE